MPIYKCNVYFHFVIVSETAVHVFRSDFLRTVDLTVCFSQRLNLSKCGVTFRYLKKAHERYQTNRLKLHLLSICKRQTIIMIANHFISCLNVY